MNATKYESIINIERPGKDITFFLEKGESLTLDNILDVEIYPKTLWIDVKERLPKKSDRYLVLFEETEKAYAVMDIMIWNQDSWIKRIGNLYSEKVIYWMPMPSLPDKKINNEE